MFTFWLVYLISINSVKLFLILSEKMKGKLEVKALPVILSHRRSISQITALNNTKSQQLTCFQLQIPSQHSNLPIPAEFTSSAEIDRPTYCSSTLQRAGIQLLSDVQVTHLEQEGKGKWLESRYTSCVHLLKMEPNGKSPPSHLVWPDTRAVEVGVSSPGVYGVLVKVFGNVFRCCLWKQPVNTLPTQTQKQCEIHAFIYITLMLQNLCFILKIWTLHIQTMSV